MTQNEQHDSEHAANDANANARDALARMTPRPVQTIVPVLPFRRTRPADGCGHWRSCFDQEDARSPSSSPAAPTSGEPQES